MTETGYTLAIVFVAIVLVMAFFVHRTDPGSAAPAKKSETANSPGLSTDSEATRRSAGISSLATPALPPTSGTGPALTYLLQAHVAKQGWVTAQKSSGQLSGFGTIHATDNELPGLANAVIRPFDNGKRVMRVVFFRGELTPDELTIDKAYGDVTPNEGGQFSPWMFMG